MTLSDLLDNLLRYFAQFLQSGPHGINAIHLLFRGCFDTGERQHHCRQPCTVNRSAGQRGIQFLLNTQLADGSWYVKSRALAFQPYFDDGFPHGFDQWISAAGTSWATMALALALPTTGSTAASPRLR